MSDIRYRNAMNWLRQIFKSRYVRMLEEENAQLRVENRAFLNSLLSRAGFPPVEFGDATAPAIAPRLRRRSWQQLQAMKQNEAERSAV
jgi:hypothetical protein